MYAPPALLATCHAAPLTRTLRRLCPVCRPVLQPLHQAQRQACARTALKGAGAGERAIAGGRVHVWRCRRHVPRPAAQQQQQRGGGGGTAAAAGEAQAAASRAGWAAQGDVRVRAACQCRVLWQRGRRRCQRDCAKCAPQSTGWSRRARNSTASSLQGALCRIAPGLLIGRLDCVAPGLPMGCTCPCTTPFSSKVCHAQFSPYLFIRIRTGVSALPCR